MSLFSLLLLNDNVTNFLSNHRNFTNDKTSSVTLGGVDKTHFSGSLTWVPIVDNAWKTKLTK